VGARSRRLTSVEICAGAGGQAIGLEEAGFSHRALVEIDLNAAETLRVNFPKYDQRVYAEDVRTFLDKAKRSHSYKNLDLLAGGVPCPPFSLAGKQLGRDDERDLFPVIIDLAWELQPKAVMIENVRGLVQAKFDGYRAEIVKRLTAAGYIAMEWEEFQAADFGVPQLRPRSILVALQQPYAPYYEPPTRTHKEGEYVTVGEALVESMVADRGMDALAAQEWAKRADRVAPTLVGGSKKHGGADLGPTRAKADWARMGIDAHGVADDGDVITDPAGPKGRGPRLTVAQAAILQGFPPHWQFQGGKTARYRQVGNAFPPMVAKAVGERIRIAIHRAEAAAASGTAEPNWSAPPQDGIPRRRRAAANAARLVRQRGSGDQLAIEILGNGGTIEPTA
jgi:DNA (cytosine-5)-methyltransferase 1